jgi:PAS domain-containing protein
MIGTPFEHACRRAMDDGGTAYCEAYNPPSDRRLGETAYRSASGIVVHARDITEQKRMEQELRAGEARFRRYFALWPTLLRAARRMGRKPHFSDDSRYFRAT